MKRGDVVTVTITRLSEQGDGLAAAEGRTLAIPGSVPGDRVEAVAGHRAKGRVSRAMVRLLEAGRPRVPPVCPLFGACGGCRWQDLAYADQLCLKGELVRDALAGRSVPLPEPAAVIGSLDQYRYRNKMEFSFGRDRAGALVLGLHARGRYNTVLDVPACCLQSEAADRVLASVRTHALRLALPVYDLQTHQGLLRFLVLRCSRLTGAVLANLVVSEYPHEGVEALVQAVSIDVPDIAAFVVTRHTGKGQAAIGQAEFVLAGSGTIADGCNGVEYTVSPRSFLQTNTAQAARLYALVAQWAAPLRGGVLDLYCGAGGISLQLAAHAPLVLGVESVPDAVCDARDNAARNGLGNCRFVEGEAERVLPELDVSGLELAVVDPPRAGLHPRVRQVLGQIRLPRILYVSCNPRTLGDDLECLVPAGYTVEQIQPIDMFPHTPHCEAVALLSRDRDP